jgi:hypothetical protein
MQFFAGAPMVSIATLAPFLQALFTTRADELAAATQFIRRQRAFSGADFLRALTFGYLKRKQAPLEDLAQPLGVSRQALDQRFTPAAADFLKRALAEAVGHTLHARPALLPLIDRFDAVYLDDCTQAPMPDDAAVDFLGCGGASPGDGKAGMKVLARWELRSGRVCHLGVHPARTSDHAARAEAPPVPKGSQHLADLGFFDLGRLRDESARGVFWVTRLPAHARLVGPDDPAGVGRAEQLRRWREQGRAEVDEAARVGGKKSALGRLVALACPREVASRRLQKLEEEARRRCRPVTERQRQLCHWTVLLTNVGADRLSTTQVWQVYRLRWQIELLFKRFKSSGGLGRTGSGKRYRVEAEWYAKLLGQVVRNWLQLLLGGPLRSVNGEQLGRTIADAARDLSRAMGSIRRLARALERLREELKRVRKRTRRKTRQTTTEGLEKQAIPA